MWLPHIGPEVTTAASGALEVGYLGLGSATKEFEEALADYLELDAGRALMSANSCTAALNCACLLAGRPDEIYRVAERHGLRVIEDAAHAIGTRHHGRMVGATGDLVCFSFGPVKTMTTLERSSPRGPRSWGYSTRASATTRGRSRPPSAWPSCRCWSYMDDEVLDRVAGAIREFFAT
jgi:dTDP-4-amino-4,6-dideoxygalactose transaminase